MKYKDPTTGQFKDISVKVADSLPIGTEVDYDGETVPTGWEQVDNPNDYSTTETRIGTWIDGKPLYRKVIKVAVSSTTQSISLNFSIDKLKSLNGGLDNGNQIIPFGYKDDSNYCSAFIQKNNNSLYCMSSWSSGTFYIILEYTKTTD